MGYIVFPSLKLELFWNIIKHDLNSNKRRQHTEITIIQKYILSIQSDHSFIDYSDEFRDSL